jgi:Na+/H+ antiporter NhaD/arsenite permease-like protein
MLVASHSRISYARFSAVLAPVALVGLAIASLLFLRLFRGTLAQATPHPREAAGEPLDRALMRKSLIVAFALLAGLIVGLPPSLAALVAASALLITRRVDPQDVWAQIDWSLLTMFAGLFVVVAGVERAGLAARGLALLDEGRHQSLLGFMGVVTALSNLVSNVPAVLHLRSWAAQFVPPERAWLALAMASTLAGNLTLVGSVANLIVVEQAGPQHRVGFWAYARVGVPVTLATLAFGYVWLLLVVPAR